jgi:glycosyltransferase involved in cell wall biosynthesis
MMKILFLSALSSNRMIEQLHKQSGKDPGFAVQKFNRLFALGLKDNGIDITVLSAPPVGRHNSKKVWWKAEDETEHGLVYHYLPFINLPVLRQLFLTIGTYFKVRRLTRKQDVDAIVCDVLNAGLCAAAIKACKNSGTQVIGVMTDMPGLMVRFGKDQKMPIITRMATKLMKWSFDNYDKFVYLTEAMDVVNSQHRPYIVMEGMSDSNMVSFQKELKQEGERVIMYAGGLHERYGLKKLVEAFMMVKEENIRLKIFGSGPFVEELQNRYCKEDSRIQYMGVAPNAEVIEAELNASLLVNPRPTNEEFTKYSFPSKNIEYMASGTPLLTTKLPSMPNEYHPYVFLIKDETVEGYAKALQDVLAHTDVELYNFGQNAKNFVLKKKNNKEQAKRVANLIIQ